MIFLNVLLFLVIVHLRARTFPIGRQLIPPLHPVLKENNIKTMFIILNQTVKISYLLLYYVDTVDLEWQALLGSSVFAKEEM